MQKTITMTLEEFEKITNENKAMREILKKEEAIGFEFRCENMGMGYIRNAWNIITKDQLIIEMNNNINDLDSKNSALHTRIWDLHNKLEQKESRKWFKFF
jgi:hypothetical protein